MSLSTGSGVEKSPSLTSLIYSVSGEFFLRVTKSTIEGRTAESSHKTQHILKLLCFI